MRIPCPTCHRRGTVDKALPDGAVMGYCGPNGERCPQEICQTCSGGGWVEDGAPGHPVTAEDVIRRARS